ncbi:hypothetical protein [Frankia sp. CiP3]|uniref:hypothetical protein n=1 Tax=Frankia sp. CiP3 TaxID=2880971 RepID=UPI0027DFAF43|nr:hypothetical protein [Frankia sp. CiP3]
MITASYGITTALAGASTLAEAAEPHKGPLEWWAVGLVTIGAILLLGLVIMMMTLADRKRHPHPASHAHARPQAQAQAQEPSA